MVESEQRASNTKHPATLSLLGAKRQSNGIQTVGIIGEGKMGTSIFYSLVDLPYSLRWIASKKADLTKLQQGFEKKIRRALRNGIMSQKEHDDNYQGTKISSDPSDASDCDLVIEAIPEVLKLKQELFFSLDNIIKPSCIFASNSSSINPSQLFTGSDREERIIGMHYFYPVPLKETVELIYTDKTSSGVLEIVEFFLHNTNKHILQLNESNSFILNRLFLDIQNEAYKIVEQGKATEEQIDEWVKIHLFPVGLFDFMDSVGIDTMLASVMNYIALYPHPEYYSGLVKKLQSLVDAGNLGMKSGQGFYRYHDSQRILSGSSVHLPDDSVREIIEFLRFTYLNTAKRFTMQSGCTVGEMNLSIREYLGLEKGPFE